MGGSMSKGHIAACCALLNPFNPLCRGMKLPDGLNGRSLPWQIHGGFVTTVNSSGNCLIQLAPTFPYGIATTQTFTTPNYTMPNGQAPYNFGSFLSNNADAVRVVNFGAKIGVTSPVGSTGGNIIVSSLNTQLGQSAVWPTFTFDAAEVDMYPAYTGEVITWWSKPLGPRTFTALNDTSTVYPYPTFTSLLVEVVGAVASATVVTVEYFANIEIQLVVNASTTAGLTHLIPVDPEPMPALMLDVAKVSRALPHAMQGAADQVAKAVEAAAAQAISNGGKSLALAVRAKLGG